MSDLVDFFAQRRARYPGHARLSLQPHRTLHHRATDPRRRGREPLRLTRRVGTLRRPLHHRQERRARGHRVLRPQAPRTPRGVRAHRARSNKARERSSSTSSGWSSGDDQLLDNIADYNEDDVKSTRALRDWLLEQRSGDLPWREAIIEREPYELDTDELVERLHEFAEDFAGAPVGRSSQLLAPRAHRPT